MLAILVTLLSSTSSAASNSRLLLQSNPPPLQAPGAPQGGGSTQAATGVAPMWPQMSMEFKSCSVPAGEPGSCANQLNAPPGGVAAFFKLECNGVTSCQGSTNYLYSAAEMLEGAWFSAENSGRGATLNIGSTVPGRKLVMNILECNAIGSCEGMVVNLVNAEVSEFICAVENSCDGCVIQEWVDPTAGPSSSYPCKDIATLGYV